MTAEPILELLIQISVEIGVREDFFEDEDAQVRVLENMSAAVSSFDDSAKSKLRAITSNLVANNMLDPKTRKFVQEFWLGDDGCLSAQER
jgi:hypothetical protein